MSDISEKYLMVTDIGKIQIRTQDLVLGLYIIFPRDGSVVAHTVAGKRVARLDFEK